MTEQSTIPGLFCFFIVFYFSLSGRRNGISYRENVLNGTKGAEKTVLYRENVLDGTKNFPDMDNFEIAK